MLLLCVMLATVSNASSQERAPYLSPAALAASPDGSRIFVACATASEVLAVDLNSRAVVQRFKVGALPTGLALTADGEQLLATCAGPRSTLELIDLKSGEFRSFPVGHTAMAPVVSRDKKTAYVCYRFENCVGIVDLQSGAEVRRIPVLREPVSAALTPDGQRLCVVNHLQPGMANGDFAGSAISLIDCDEGRVIKEFVLPSGSTGVNEIRISPDGKYAVATHLVARFQIPAAQLERGWMNTNAKTIIDLVRGEILDTVLLDDVDSGAANPWGLAWSRDGSTLVIAHAGTHELSLIDFPQLLRRLRERREQLNSSATPAVDSALEPVNDLAFLGESRRRLHLPSTDRGPRAVVVSGNLAIAANYFSDSLSMVDLTRPGRPPETLRLGPGLEMDELRRGEFCFHDASICFQTWQSCSSCHPGGGRVDALNWDLLNDGIANPKNTKSLLLSHRTPPAMSLGIRDTAETAVRAGIRSVLMTVQPPALAKSIDVYLKSLKPVSSPRLVAGALSPAAVRGEQVFRKASCGACHPKGLFTDLQSYDVGTGNAQDRRSEQFDTPTLLEVWRTAPYLHDGSAETIQEVLTTRNKDDQHGVTSSLSAEELSDLCEFVLSL